MKPEVLQRRDLWFSDRDYGGGEDRYKKYTKYAKKIGQGKIYREPDHEARQKHLAEGGVSGHYNEVYLKHEISWDEIDTIFVKAENSSFSYNSESSKKSFDLTQKVTEIVSNAKKDGLLPDSIQVQVCKQEKGKRITELICERAQLLA
jgi:hypothetical protein